MRAGLALAAVVMAQVAVAAESAPGQEAAASGAGHAPVSGPELAGPAPDPWPPGEGSEIARRACHDCHDPIVITASRLTAAQWSARVDAMLAKGAKVGDDEIDVLIDYLATHFGPDR